VPKVCHFITWLFWHFLQS